MKRKEKIGVFIVLWCGAMWGLSGVLGEMLFKNTKVTVGLLASLRMLLSGIVILIYLIIKDGKKTFNLWKNKQMIVPFLLFCILGLMAVQYTYFAAVNTSNAATATVLQYTYPVIVLLYTSISSKKAPKSYEIISIFLAFLGVILIATHGNLSSLSISLIALIWGLLSAFSFVFYTIYPKKLYKELGLLSIMGWSFFVGGLVLFIVTKSYSIKFDTSPYSISLFSIITIFGTMIPFVIYGKGVEWLGEVRASLFVTVEPICSAILALVLLKTTFTKIDVIGFISIILAIELVAYKTLRERKKAIYNVQLHKKSY